MLSRRRKNDKFSLNFIRSKNGAGEDCYFFLQSTDMQVRLLDGVLGKPGKLDLNKYGTVLASGFGHIPSQYTIRKLQEEYGYDAAIFSSFTNASAN